MMAGSASTARPIRIPRLASLSVGLSRTVAIAAVITSLLAALAGLQWSSHVATRNGFFQRFQTRGAIAAEFVGSYTKDVLRRERDFARTHLAQSPTPEAMARMTDAFGMAGAILVEDGKYVMGSPHDPDAIGSDLTSYDHIRAAVDGTPTVSNVITSVVRRDAIVGLAVPLDVPNRNLVVTGGLSVEDSPIGRAYLESIIPIERSTVFLLDEDHNVVASGRPGHGMPLGDAAPALERSMRTGDSGSFEDDLGNERYFTAQRVDGTPWTLVLAASADHILAPVQGTWAQWLLLVALALAAAVTIALVNRLFRSRTELEGLNDQLEARVHERTAELAASNAELESFAYSVSHDLRAPLRAMDGFSKIVMDEYAETLQPEGRRFLGMVRENAMKMQALIDDLLRYSRLGRHKLELAPIDVDAVVERVLQDLAPVIEEHGTRVHVFDLPPALGDQTLLWQVFSNLIGNAVKFSRGADEPTIEVGGSTARDGGVAYWIRDNGTGFDMQYADKLFGVFQRLHRSEDFEGSGVGLATVQRIVTRHGGRIWAESEPNKGATFYVELKGTNDG